MASNEPEKAVPLEDDPSKTSLSEEKSLTVIGVSTTSDYKPCLIATDGEKEYESIITVDKLIDFLGKDKVRQLFPLVMAVEDKIYMVSSDKSSAVEIELDLDDEGVARAQADKYGLLWAQVQSFRKLLQQEFTVPEKYRDKYCLIFCGQVFFSADTYEEIQEKRVEVPLDFKEYIPAKPQKIS